MARGQRDPTKVPWLDWSEAASELDYRRHTPAICCPKCGRSDGLCLQSDDTFLCRDTELCEWAADQNRRMERIQKLVDDHHLDR